jgi:hypothetical protein
VVASVTPTNVIVPTKPNPTAITPTNNPATNLVAVAPTNATPAPITPITNIVTQPTVPIVTQPPVQPASPPASTQPVVADLARLGSHGLGDEVMSNYLRGNPLASPLSAADENYLRSNNVPQSIIDLLHRTTPAPVSTNQGAMLSPNSDVHTMLKSAYDLFKEHQDKEAIDYCEQVLKIEPQNPNAWCIKAASEDALHQNAQAMIGYTTFLKLPAAQTPQFAAWHSYCTARLRAIRGW